MIKFENVRKEIGNKIIFEDLNFEVEKGEMLAIVGPSGSGKTTLLNMIGLIEPFDTGKYWLENQLMNSNKTAKNQKIIREKIAYLFQNFALIDTVTVEKNLLIALKYVKKSKQEKAKMIADVLRETGLAGYEKRKIYELSGGEQQRIAIARSFLKPSELILADEPTGSLDARNRDEIMILLAELRKSGKCVIIVTHDEKVAQKCSKILEIGK